MRTKLIATAMAVACTHEMRNELSSFKEVALKLLSCDSGTGSKRSHFSPILGILTTSTTTYKRIEMRFAKT